jgi:iron complex outermembrane receptor protein
MRTNHQVSLAIKRALATGTIVLCGAGFMAAHAQQTTTGQEPATRLATAKATEAKRATAKALWSKHSPAKESAAKQTTTKAPALLAQATAAPANATAANSQQLQTVVITGSLISRTSIETPNPVQVISSKDLVQSGYTDISSVLHNITANGASTLSQSFSFAFAAGASGISLRGLTVGDTLVLIDGERSVPYPLLDDNQRSFVDVASIPFMAVEQVQVDKNGASAVYGSDAIAGVVNVILRKEFQGFKATAESGTSQRGDGTMEHFGFIGGHGDLANDGYNWYVSGEFRHQDQILASKRSGLWDNLDWTPWGGTYGGFTNLGVSTVANPFYPYPASTSGYLVDPSSSATDPTAGMPVFYLPGCAGALAQASNKCTAIYPGAQLQPPTTRIDVLGKFTKQLNQDWQLQVQASWFNSKAEQIDGYNTPSPNNNGTNYPTGLFNFAFGPGIPLTVVPSTQLTTPNIITLPTTNPMYPSSMCPAGGTANPAWCGSPLALVYSFPEIGPQGLSTTTNTYRLLASLDGNAGGWKIDGAAGAMYAKMQYRLFGQIEWQQLQSALNNGYILGSPSGLSTFAPPEEATPWSELDLINVHGTHSLFDLPGGPVELAIGAEWYKKVQDETAPASAVSGMQGEAGGPIYVIGTEKDTAAFAELDGRPIKQLEIDAAARYDNYQHFGSATTPQIGLKFTPWRQVALRGTWGKGFRAPSAAEGGQSGELFGAGSYTDPVLCPAPSPGTGIAGPGDFPSQCGFALQGFQASNPHLQNVKSSNWTAGVILQPIRQASVSVDYYNVKINNDIISGFEAGGFAAGYGTLLRGAPVSLPFCPASNTGGCTPSQLVNATTPVGTILVAQYPYINAGSTHTSGFDVDLKAHYDAGPYGLLSAEITWTHLLTYQLTVAGSTYELAGTHGPSGISGDTGNPKDRGVLQASWQKGPLTIAPSLNFVGHFSITDPSSGIPSCSSALGYFGRFPGGLTPQDSQFCTVGYFLETNLFASYQVGPNFQVHASVTNLFGKQPPVDIQTYGAGTYFYPYDAAFEQEGAVGRFFTLGVDYQF